MRVINFSEARGSLKGVNDQVIEAFGRGASMTRIGCFVACKVSPFLSLLADTNMCDIGSEQDIAGLSKNWRVPRAGFSGLQMEDR